MFPGKCWIIDTPGASVLLEFFLLMGVAIGFQKSILHHILGYAAYLASNELCETGVTLHKGKVDGCSSLFELRSNSNSLRILVLRSYPFQGKTNKQIIMSLILLIILPLNTSLQEKYSNNFSSAQMSPQTVKGLFQMPFSISVTEEIHFFFF